MNTYMKRLLATALSTLSALALGGCLMGGGVPYGYAQQNSYGPQLGVGAGVPMGAGGPVGRVAGMSAGGGGFAIMPPEAGSNPLRYSRYDTITHDAIRQDDAMRRVPMVPTSGSDGPAVQGGAPATDRRRQAASAAQVDNLTRAVSGIAVVQNRHGRDLRRHSAALERLSARRSRRHRQEAEAAPAEAPAQDAAQPSTDVPVADVTEEQP